ncbi:MAG: M20/M25/M40 family metallo-hydrolase [Promethearchaeota archaeon]
MELAGEFVPVSPFAKECLEVFRKLLKFDTSNPPGNETPAAEFLADLAAREGFQPELHEKAPGRGNLVFRWGGTDPDAPSVCVGGHLDTVPADPDEWERDPWGADVVDGFVWGRGALDCKNTVVGQFMALALLKREGFRPRGDVVFVAEADEEQLGRCGAAYLVRELFPVVKADFAVNEGGGVLVPFGKTPQYTIQTSEKGCMWTKVRVRGTAGHGSVQTTSRTNALLKLVEVIERIDRARKPVVVTDWYREMVAGLQLPGLVKRLLTSKRLLPLTLKLAARAFGPVAEEFVGSLVRNTFNPTVVKASEKENVVPSSAEVVYDVRVLPGFDREDVTREFLRMVGPDLEDQVELVPVESSVATGSPAATTCYRRIEETLQELHPGCTTLPFFLSGATDNRFFRERGIPAYGFVPYVPDDDLPFEEYGKLIHGKDERISVANLMRGVAFFHEFLRKW